MTDEIKHGDFIEVSYSAKLKDGDVFDTTDEKVANEHDLEGSKERYGNLIICVGEGQILQGLDKKLEGKKVGRYTIELSPEEGFGKKSAKLIQLINTQKFVKQGVFPQVGLQVQVDHMMGVVKSVSGGRTIVDFNHPLSGKDVVYDVTIVRKVTNDLEKARGYLHLLLDKSVEVSEHEGTLTIITKMKLPDAITKHLEEKLKKHISYKAYTFLEAPKEEKKEATPENNV